MNLIQGMRRPALAAALVALLGVVSCGGGDPVVEFEPDRVLAFGDENSLLTSDGHKYTVNTLKDVSGVKTLDCATNPIWVQRLAGANGLVFPQCNPNNVVDPRSRIYAEEGATVADVIEQIDQHLATDTFSSKDLVTLYAGHHDILELYAQYPGSTRNDLLAAARDRGAAMARQVSRIAAAGGKVLISTAPDLGLSPFALKENVDTGDSSRDKLLSDLAETFNEGLRIGLINEDGTHVALMLTDELIQTMEKFPGSYSMDDDTVDVAVCDITKAPTLLQCTTDTLVTDGTARSHLWADATHLSPNGHAYLGSLASSRVRNNPF
jgi:hypothetical protein